MNWWETPDNKNKLFGVPCPMCNNLEHNIQSWLEDSEGLVEGVAVTCSSCEYPSIWKGHDRDRFLA